jgi:hypothetical protein
MLQILDDAAARMDAVLRGGQQNEWFSTSAVSPAVNGLLRHSRRPPPQTRKHPLLQVFSVMRAEGFEPSTLGLSV